MNLLPIQIYINRTESKIIFEINNGYHLELLTPKNLRAAIVYVIVRFFR